MFKEFGIVFIISIFVLCSIVGTADQLSIRNSMNKNSPEPIINHTLIPQKTPRNREILFSEEFEGSFPPTGWTRIITNTGYCDSYPQYAAHWDQFSDVVHNGTKAAYVWWDYQPQDEWLITPQINFVDIPNGELRFWSYGYEGSTHNDHYYVKISTDNGSTWTVLFDLSSFPPDQGWNSYSHPYIIDLAAYHGQMITLAWQALSTQNDGIWYQWCIDDIEVIGGDVTPPVTSCEIEGAFEKTITLTATDDLSGVNQTVYKLDNGVWIQYSVPITVSVVGDHIVYYYSIDNAGNIEEEKNQVFTVSLPVTITITGGVGVSMTIKNVGTTNISDVDWSLSLTGKLIFVGNIRSGKITTLTPGEELTFKDNVVGFGKTDIRGSVGSQEKVVSGRVFLFFVFGV
jgi:hypothetical protein